MKRQHLDFDEFLKESLKNPKIRREYEKLQPEYEIVSAIIRARIEKDLTQKDLAKKLGTKQSAIARIESGKANPTIAFLKKLANALDSNLEIKFTSL